MQRALQLAARGRGHTRPNPLVGAVICDRKGNVLATGWHRRAGHDHAEVAALRKLGFHAPGATLYVNLEPCNHHGRTPPCTEAIIHSGIRHVAIGLRDPNPHVAGGGIERLKQARVDVVSGVDEEECRQLIAPFLFYLATGKPWITVKRAFDRNGSPVPPPGQKTFTSPESLRLAHQLRKKSDAIITGSGTILADDPLFTVRYVPDHPGKRRMLAIIDRRKRAPANYLADAAGRGLDAAAYDDIRAALDDLARRGARDILVEAGPLLSAAMLDSPFWNLSVSIRQGNPDRVETHFNPRQSIPFSTDQFQWEWFLPA